MTHQPAGEQHTGTLDLAAGLGNPRSCSKLRAHNRHVWTDGEIDYDCGGGAAEASSQKPVKASDLFGIDPDFTGESCSVDYVRWQRGADAPGEYIHVACWSFLNKREPSTTASPISDELADAILAVKERGVPCPPKCDYQTHRRAEMRAVLEAAYPAIRQQVAEEIATAIEEASANIYYGNRHALHEAVDVAREIGAKA
jgi:hypothetical protein